jgi:hypothetical protein
MHADLCDDRFEQRATATTFSGHPKDCILDTGPEGCHTFVIGFGHPLNANDLSMDDLVCCIENWTDHPLMNRANLRGPFSYATARAGGLLKPPHDLHGTGQTGSIFLSLQKHSGRRGR